MWQRLYQYVLESRFQFAWQGVFFLALLLFSDIGAAKDLLENSQENLRDTVMGTGKIFLYLIEAIIAIALYIKTRNLMVFIGVIVIAIFIEVISKKFLGL